MRHSDDPIQILFQDQNFVVVEKPPGISIHNNEDPLNLLKVLGEQLQLAKLFPVHRLDKETSGIQILALNEAHARKLADEFQTRAVKKIYHGLLRGELKSKAGQWNQSLTDKAEGRRQPAGQNPDRIACETRWSVEQASQYFSLCRFDLITGRQHQIRKHAAMANHPIVGDSRYGDPRYNQKIAELHKIERMLLHCSEVEILRQTFTSPVPEAFRLI